MADKRLIKEFKQLSKEGENPQITSLEPELENIFKWRATITKPSRNESQYYFNGKWDLIIEVPSLYPLNPPKISFDKKTPIAHPNIDLNTGEICLDILKLSSWSPAWNINYLVVAILMLIDDPEPDSPLNIDMANLYRSDKVAYESVAQYNIWKYGTFEQERLKSGVKQLEFAEGHSDSLNEQDNSSTLIIESAAEQVKLENIDKTSQSTLLLMRTSNRMKE